MSPGVHVCPEAVDGGLIDLVQDGDVIDVDAVAGVLQLQVSAQDIEARKRAAGIGATSGSEAAAGKSRGIGRELFAAYRRNARPAEEGAVTWL